MKTTVEYPKLWNLWSNMRKIGWIQEQYGEYNEEKDILEMKKDTPKEIMDLYNKLWDEVEAQQANGQDVD